jgi:hypothetical protein
MVGGDVLGVRRLDAAFMALWCDQLTLKRRRQAAALQGALRAQSSYLIVGNAVGGLDAESANHAS